MSQDEKKPKVEYGEELYTVSINGYIELQTTSPIELEQFCIEEKIDEISGIPSWRIH